jgi:hypothetical protein
MTIFQIKALVES